MAPCIDLVPSTPYSGRRSTQIAHVIRRMCSVSSAQMLDDVGRLLRPLSTSASWGAINDSYSVVM